MAFEALPQTAEQGNAKAQATLALKYDHGDGVEQSFAKAAEWQMLSDFERKQERKKEEAGAEETQWKAGIYYAGKHHHLGVFKTKEQAAHAYDNAARKHRKDLPLNFASTEEGAKAAAEAGQQQKQRRSKQIVFETMSAGEIKSLVMEKMAELGWVERRATSSDEVLEEGVPPEPELGPEPEPEP